MLLKKQLTTVLLTIDQTPAQYDLNHPLINLRSNIEKLKALDLDEILQDLFPKYYEF